jgi:uncharacterized protein YbjT (DUF2867 family)
MKITVIGATGQIGSAVVEILATAGHEVVGAARSTGVDVLTGDGLTEALSGAEVVVDVTNSPSFEDEPVLAFFTTASANIVTAAKAAGVGHYVALSIVGVDGLPESGYMRAKVVQESTITGSGLPYTVVRATQFHEVAAVAQGSPVNGVIDIGGPEKMSFAELAETLTLAGGAQAPIVVDSAATYFGTPVGDDSLVTGLGAVIAGPSLRDWLAAR